MGTWQTSFLSLLAIWPHHENWHSYKFGPAQDSSTETPALVAKVFRRVQSLLLSGARPANARKDRSPPDRQDSFPSARDSRQAGRFYQRRSHYDVHSGNAAARRGRWGISSVTPATRLFADHVSAYKGDHLRPVGRGFLGF